MLNLLAKIFIKNPDDVKNPEVRTVWGLLCSIYTIALNVLMFAAKYIAGMLAGSVAITADSFNNLSDAGSSILTLFGFRFAGKKPTPERPFGHGRIEYITGLIISAMILIVGVSTLRDSVDAIANPEDVQFSVLSVAVLLVSIAVKFYMAMYGRRIGGRIESSALKATASDNMTDTISTGLTLVSLLLNRFFGWKLDGWVALIVAILLIKAGIECGWETVKDLLGKKADPELVRQIQECAMSYDEIIGIHDLIIHDYGPGRLYVTLHCEVDGSRDVYELHDAMDRCMNELDRTIGCESVIHMDPINTDDGITAAAREKVIKLLRENIDERISVHDFRMVTGPTHDNLLFDVLVPLDIKLSDDEVEERVTQLVSGNFEHRTFAIVKIDKPYA